MLPFLPKTPSAMPQNEIAKETSKKNRYNKMAKQVGKKTTT